MEEEKFPFEKDAQAKTPQKEAPKEPSKAPLPAHIPISDGLITPQTHTDLYRMAEALIKTKAVPKQFESPEQVMMGMQVLRQLGLPDIAGLRQLAIINGSFALWGELPKAIADAKRLIETCHEFWFDKDYQPICFANKNLNAEAIGAVCKIKRRGYEHITERAFTIEDARVAGLWNKDIWKKYPRRMLQMRARSWALKDACPDAVSGIAIAEYDYDMLPDVTDEVTVKNTSPVAEEINNLIEEKQSA